MGLDHSIMKIKSKVNDNLTYKKLRQEKWIELNQDYEEFYKWEVSLVELDSQWCIHSFINRVTHSGKVDYDKDEDLILNKQHIQFLIKELHRKLKTYKGLREILRLQDYSKQNQKKIIKSMDRGYWRKKLLVPLEKILKETDFDMETVFYGAWY